MHKYMAAYEYYLLECYRTQLAGQVPVFVNEVLLEHNQAHLFIYYLQLIYPLSYYNNRIE